MRILTLSLLLTACAAAPIGTGSDAGTVVRTCDEASATLSPSDLACTFECDTSVACEGALVDCLVRASTTCATDEVTCVSGHLHVRQTGMPCADAGVTDAAVDAP